MTNTPHTLWLDLETFNEADIKVGTYRYAETAVVLLFAYALDDGPVRVWDNASGETMPGDLFGHLTNPDTILVAHNAMFDRTMIKHALDLDTDIARWRCTMVQAYSHALPGSLEAAGAALGMGKDQAKMADGKKLIHRFCKPAPSNHKAERYDVTTHPEEWAKFKEYAARDIDAMRELARRLPIWNWKPSDIEMYHLDQRINDRGFAVDRELVEAGAIAAVDDRDRMAREFIEATGGDVERPGQREKFRCYLNERFGLDLDNTRAETFREYLQDETLHPACRQLMEISVMSNKTSTAKYATLEPAISSDGRFRGGLQFRGAARTRRWSGRTFQPQNLPSRGLPGQDAIDQYIGALKLGVHDVLFDDLMLYGSAALRGVLVAPEGQRLAVADLSNIEGRVNAYLAGERWKLEAFAAYDQGKGPDLYNITAGAILGQDPYEVNKADRNVFGKVPELALGYESGFVGLQTFAKGYGVSLYDHWDTIRANVDAQHIASAKANYTRWGKERNPEADEAEWIASETIKLAWRARHPKIVALWKACKEAATLAIESPGKTINAGPWLQFAVREHAGVPYLLMRLPSGNFLCYCQPKISERKTGRTDRDGNPVFEKTLTYMGIDATATGGAFGKWQRLYTYGGKLVENACQALALDMLTANMPAIERAGYGIVLTVHDEIAAETSDGDGDDLARLMEDVPAWAPGFPLAAAGFTADRYRK
jgi:DNA polymerase